MPELDEAGVALRIALLERKVDAVDDKLVTVEGKLVAFDAKTGANFDDVKRDVGALTTAVAKTDANVGDVKRDLGALTAAVAALLQRLDALPTQLADIRAALPPDPQLAERLLGPAVVAQQDIAALRGSLDDQRIPVRKSDLSKASVTAYKMRIRSSSA